MRTDLSFSQEISEMALKIDLYEIPVSKKNRFACIWQIFLYSLKLRRFVHEGCDLALCASTM